LTVHGKDAVDVIKKYGSPAVELMKIVNPTSADTLLKTLDDDVLDYAMEQGPDAVAALSRWSSDELSEHGAELALRAEKDAKVLSDVKKLLASGPINPKHLTQEQQDLINAIAKNSTQYKDGAQIVLGKWTDLSSGFAGHANDTGSISYQPHPDMYNLLGQLGENRDEVAWLVNKQVIQKGIDKGLPFEYTLNGIPAKDIAIEHDAVQAALTGANEIEIMQILGFDYMPIRMKELQEMQKAGYEFSFDNLTNSYILIRP